MSKPIHWSMRFAAAVLLTGCGQLNRQAGDGASGAAAGAPIFPIAGYGCFAQGTPIATPTGDVPIEQIRIGDSVLAYDFVRRSVVSALVTDTIAHDPEPVIHLVSPGGTTLRVTPNHPVYLVESGRFEPAGQIGGASDSLVLTSLASAAPLRVGLSHTTSPELVPVYDLTVGSLHNYFAAGVLVHNKERCWTNSSGCHVCADTTQICVPGTAGRSSPPVNVPRDAGPPVTTPPPNPQSRPKPGDSEDAGGDAG